MNKEERNMAIEKIQSDVDKIKRDVEWIAKQVAYIVYTLTVKNQPNPIPPTVPYAPNDVDPYIGVTKCQKCGIEFKGPVGYVCADNLCPTYMKPRIRTGSYSYTANSSGNWQLLYQEPKE